MSLTTSIQALLPQSLRKGFTPLLLAVIAGLSMWLFMGQPEKGPVVTPQTLTAPDSFMENFTTQVLDKQGRPQYELRAARMAHYADDDHSELTAPQFTAYRPSGQQWTVVAETGESRNGTRQILLNGRVDIQRRATADAPANLEIHTRDVRVRPADDYAETDQPTIIVRSEGTVETVGLQVHFREGQVLLLSQVRGTYAP